jgi:hypothetical protein
MPSVTSALGPQANTLEFPQCESAAIAPVAIVDIRCISADYREKVPDANRRLQKKFVP